MNGFKNLRKVIAGVVLMSSILTGCNLQLTSYDNEFKDGPFEGADNGQTAFISSYTWDGDTDNMIITIPAEHNGLPITRLGGTLGQGGDSRPFEFIDTSKDQYEYFTTPEEYVSFNDKALSSDEIQYIDFELHIGKEINSITVMNNILGMNLKVVDGKNVCFVYRFYLVCEPGNEFYYSKDGVLYEVATDQKVNCFFYWNEEVEY